VNWFRKGLDGTWLWPGFGENSRVLKWMCERVDGTARARDTAIGRVPVPEDLDLLGLDVPAEDLRELLRVDREAWKAEAKGIRKHFGQFGDRLPGRLSAQLDALGRRLDQA
jgi:phosphoenolpyruvate carboxykinase (GTP)